MQRPDAIHGGLYVKNAGKSESQTKIKYDRKSFYPSEFLKLSEAPNFLEIHEIEKKDRDEFTIVKFDISAIRKSGQLGIFINHQRDFVVGKDIYMFYDEFQKITLREFDVISLENVHFLQPSVSKIDKNFKDYVLDLFEKKNKLEQSPDKIALRKVVKNKLVLSIVSCATTPRGGFDRLSLSYLQSICRIKMYENISRTRKTLVSVFVDEICLTRKNKDLDENEEWRTSWQKH